MEERKRKRKRKRSKAPIVVIVIVLILVAAWFAMNIFYDKTIAAVSDTDMSTVTVEIPDGTSNAGVAAILKQSGLMDDVILGDYFYRIHCKRMGYEGQFKAGTYEFNRTMSFDEMASVLLVGNRAETKRFTIPEGYNITQIVRTLEEAGISTADDLYYEIESGEFDYAFLADCPPGRERLEGFLYPETYEVYADATAHEVLTIMLEQFDRLFSPDYYDRAAERGMSVRDIVTMGSIIEREAVVPEERPIMSGVFYNRLEKGMKLESCATIQYILGEPKEFLTIADTQIESPYNTYLHEGLPPGPICNPRIESIEAALYPDDNEYIFFVLSPNLDGSHNFSVDYDEFLVNKDAYYAAQ